MASHVRRSLLHIYNHPLQQPVHLLDGEDLQRSGRRTPKGEFLRPRLVLWTSGEPSLLSQWIPTIHGHRPLPRLAPRALLYQEELTSLHLDHQVHHRLLLLGERSTSQHLLILSRVLLRPSLVSPQSPSGIPQLGCKTQKGSLRVFVFEEPSEAETCNNFRGKIHFRWRELQPPPMQHATVHHQDCAFLRVF